MYSLLTAALIATLTPAQQQNQPNRPGQQPATPQGQQRPGDASPHSIDGNWTVICLEKNGQPVAEAKNVTVSIRDNVVTFTSPANTAERDRMKAMRLDFSGEGKIRVTEAGADGKFANTAPGAAPGTTTGAAPGSAGNQSKPGVYILTRDYLSVCIHDEQPREGAAARTEVGKPSGKSYCTVVLKRSDSSSPRPNP